MFEAQTLSNFFRFPMIFFCGRFFPTGDLPPLLQPLAWLLPLTYGRDALHDPARGGNDLPILLDLGIICGYGVGLFLLSLLTIRWRWIA